MSQKTFLVPPNCRMLASTGRDLSIGTLWTFYLTWAKREEGRW